MTRLAFAGRGAALLIVALSLAGCVAAPFEAVSAAASGVEAGATVITRGKIETVEAISYADAGDATLQVVERLAFAIVEDFEKKNDRLRIIRVEDEYGSTVTIILRRMTPALTKARVVVGMFGSEAMARRVTQELIQAFADHRRAASAGE